MHASLDRLNSKNLFRHKEHRVKGMKHGDDSVVTGLIDRIADLFQLQGCITRKHQSAKQKIALEQARSGINKIPDMSTFSCRLQQYIS